MRKTEKMERIHTVWKKCLAFIMAAVLVLTSVDVTVFAAGEGVIDVDDEGKFGTIKDNYRTVLSGTYRLTKDIELTYPLKIGEDQIVTILFDGHTLKQITSGRSVIQNRGTLTLGSDTDKVGTITGGTYSGVWNYGILTSYATISGNKSSIYQGTSVDGGGGVYNKGGTFTNKGNIYGNTAAKYGGGVCNTYDPYNTSKRSTFTNYGKIYGNTARDGGGVYNSIGEFTNYGKIYDNTATTNGGGVFNSGGTFINNEEIYDNTATTNGGGVFNSGGTFTNNEEIYGNTAKEKGGGVLLYGGSLSIGGKVIVSGNTSGSEGTVKEDNVAIINVENGKIVIEKELKEGSYIGVNILRDVYDTTRLTGVVTSGYSAQVSSKELKYFFQDGIQGEEFLTTLVSGEVKIIKHSHSWKYEVSDSEKNIIKAYCINGDAGSNDCPYYGTDANGEKKTVTLTLNADNATYNDSDYTGASLKGKDAFESNTKATVGEITYAGREGTEYSSSNIFPTAVGSYTAKVTVKESGGKSYTLEKDFTISKKTPTASVVMSGYTFGDTPSKPSIEENSGYDGNVTYYYSKINQNLNGTEWTNIVQETLDPGTYYMYAELSETNSYERCTTDAVPFTVGAGTLPSITASSFEKTYDGGGYIVSRYQVIQVMQRSSTK